LTRCRSSRFADIAETGRRAYIVRCFGDGCHAEIIVESGWWRSGTLIVFQTPEEGYWHTDQALP
jgi:hypothetical protein